MRFAWRQELYSSHAPSRIIYHQAVAVTFAGQFPTTLHVRSPNDNEISQGLIHKSSSAVESLKCRLLDILFAIPPLDRAFRPELKMRSRERV